MQTKSLVAINQKHSKTHALAKCHASQKLHAYGNSIHVLQSAALQIMDCTLSLTSFIGERRTMGSILLITALVLQQIAIAPDLWFVQMHLGSLLSAWVWAGIQNMISGISS